MKKRAILSRAGCCRSYFQQLQAGGIPDKITRKVVRHEEVIKDLKEEVLSGKRNLNT